MSNTTLWIDSDAESVFEDRRWGWASVETAGSSCKSTLRRHGVLLHPQPTSDPLDPLNWTALRKHSILAIVMWLYFMFTYITTTTVPSFPQIQSLFNISYTQVNLTVAIPSIGLALGPLVWSSLSDIYGRRIIFIAGTTIAFVATIGTAISGSYSTYMAARAFQGFGVSPAGAVGMAIINDMFFDYERGQKLGLWVLAINSGLLIGPIIGGVMDLVSLYWIDWLVAIMFGTLLLLELAFLPETLYPRNHMLAKERMKESGRGWEYLQQPRIDRTTNLSFINLKPVPGMRHPRPWDAAARLILTFRYPVVVMAVVAYCFMWYWWTLSIITMIPAAYPTYKPQIQGLLFLGLLLGTWFAELFCSGTLSDWIVLKFSERNGGVRVPETRLWLAYPAALFSAAGLVIWGISVDRQLHWLIGQIAFFLFAMGLQMGNTIIPSYIVDCYPLQSMSVITFYSVILDLSAVINPFFIADWIAAYNYTTVFTVAGIITFCLAVPVISIVHYFGPKIRERSGQPGWVNPEYDIL